MKLIDWFVDRWMSRCKHNGEHVAFDILEGSGGNIDVGYCRRCGAVRPSYSKEWRRPRPLWFPDESKPLSIVQRLKVDGRLKPFLLNSK